MISKSQISFIKSLSQKKFRKEHQLFVVEGLKSLQEFLQSDFEVDSVFATENLMPKLANLSHNIKNYPVSETELGRISSLNNPQGLLALIRIPQPDTITAEQLKGSFSLVLDGVQDPGNLGTIIRTADWFGIKTIICSEDTVESFNPKVVQATMGSLARTRIIYTDLEKFLVASPLPLYGALLDGTSIYDTRFGSEGLIVMGNEGNGIRPSILQRIQHAVTIPNFGQAESLNVAISTAIFCSELRRNS